MDGRLIQSSMVCSRYMLLRQARTTRETGDWASHGSEYLEGLYANSILYTDFPVATSADTVTSPLQ